TVMYALQEGLAILREEGLEQGWKRHERVAEMIRRGIEAAGLKLLAPAGNRSNTVTAIHSPAPSPEHLRELIGLLRTRYGVVVAGGQRSLQGKIFRIGHLGFIDERDVYTILGSLEAALADLGMLSRMGLSIPVAQATARRVDGDGRDGEQAGEAHPGSVPATSR
ncbi:MAG TPA: hypothetical protein VE219_00285, partial [Candidatus Sulfotelmatobacter sp.]|nr:hypothetical protein [Candidatus Sulfotelmatobacter sp.]